jgi:hypothetical protein
MISDSDVDIAAAEKKKTVDSADDHGESRRFAVDDDDEGRPPVTYKVLVTVTNATSGALVLVPPSSSLT